MHVHGVVAAKGFAAIWTLARAVGETVLDAIVTKNVTARFDDRVFEIALAHLTLKHSLRLQLVPI